MSSVRCGTPLGVGWTVLLALLLFPAGAVGMQTREPAPSATMLRVLAEAADQYRTGRPVFLVADYRFPHNVAGPFATRAEAMRVQTDSGGSFGVFGPYVTQPDSGSDSTPRVRRVLLVVDSPEGRRDTIDVDPRVDALFFSMPAMDKFLIPYYSKVYGTTYAATLRMAIGIRRPVCHLGSKACWPKPGGIVFIPVWDPVRGPLR